MDFGWLLGCLELLQGHWVVSRVSGYFCSVFRVMFRVVARVLMRVSGWLLGCSG